MSTKYAVFLPNTPAPQAQQVQQLLSNSAAGNIVATWQYAANPVRMMIHCSGKQPLRD